MDIDDSNILNVTHGIVDEFDIENEFQIQPLNEAYKKYYDTLTTIVLCDGESDDDEQNEELFEVIKFKKKT